MIKFVSDLRQVGAFLWVLQFSSTNKTDRHNITEILLKVALNTTTVTFSLACPCSVPLEECSNLTRDGKPTPSLQTSMLIIVPLRWLLLVFFYGKQYALKI